MVKTLNTPSNSLHKRQGKDKYFQAQTKMVFTAFYGRPKTMLMVSIETGILRANICRYVARMQELDYIRLVQKGICPVTKYRAGYYTTNPDLFPAIVEPSKNRLP